MPPTPKSVSNNERKESASAETTHYNAPQLKFAEDGSIVLNEESLVIQRPHVEPVFDSTIIENDHNDSLTYKSYRKFHHTKKWSNIKFPDISCAKTGNLAMYVSGKKKNCCQHILTYK